MEEVVIQVEQAQSLEAAVVDGLREDIELPGALRWTRRRVKGIHAALTALSGLLPLLLSGCLPTLLCFRERLEVEPCLPVLRGLAADYLARLPPPLGFGPRPTAGGGPRKGLQHQVGPDPPAEAA